MTRRAGRAVPAQLAPVATLAAVMALAAWAFFPVVLLLVHAAANHAEFTGADGLIGAHGVLGADQLQYLAWARDSADHGLASDLFTFEPNGHVYLEPVFALIGVLHRAGVGLVAGYMALKAITVCALAASATAWARRLIGDRPGALAATVVLALFTFTPVAALITWLQTGSGPFLFATYLIGGELLPAAATWGSLPTALSLALVPVALLALERAVAGEGRVRATAVAGAAALVASWLHPWQGITLGLIVVGLALVRRRDWLVLGTVAVAAALPLVYYLLLSHHDPAWRMASVYERGSRFPASVLLLGLGPLAVLGALGARRPGDELAEQALALWVPAALIAYFANDAFSSHALEGLTFPFAVFAVRGARRVRLPAVAGIAAVALLTLPGLVYLGRKFVRTTQTSLVQYYLPHSDAAALRWVDRRGPPGGVLAPTPFATLVPEYTGRRVWVGYAYWSRDYDVRASQVGRLFGGHMGPPAALRGFVRATGARMLVADCGHPADLARSLGPLLAATHRFGCARVYVLHRS